MKRRPNQPVPKGVKTRLFCHGGLLNRVTEAALKALFVEMIPGDMVRARVNALPMSGEPSRSSLRRHPFQGGTTLLSCLFGNRGGFASAVY